MARRITKQSRLRITKALIKLFTTSCTRHHIKFHAKITKILEHKMTEVLRQNGHFIRRRVNDESALIRFVASYDIFHGRSNSCIRQNVLYCIALVAAFCG